ncbi:barstar family protein [Candidatus Nitrosacidococcus sp. I8]|uniref:barstar family protein n=1 Tax=Candidatus Nitrosacidococcus sp. I8 TaxID=2942908 RepID=UPI002227E6B7|nr:barstar family protein [Candidatus Nitrosacidococcus sp. I8]CAH9019007.1 hypothetical protein NURINAE_01272 [Candidatus Nitrosacidococcus sp. I8]
MNNISIDFSEIKTFNDFYIQLKIKIAIPDYFGNNLDALYDFFSGEASLPLNIEFNNMSTEQINTFQSLIETMEALSTEVPEIYFHYY